tara:strand:- start:3076 stop:3345 length:270 start_codon:yes stop_codon:yes gene_type:complete
MSSITLDPERQSPPRMDKASQAAGNCPWIHYRSFDKGLVPNLSLTSPTTMQVSRLPSILAGGELRASLLFLVVAFRGLVLKSCEKMLTR